MNFWDKLAGIFKGAVEISAVKYENCTFHVDNKNITDKKLEYKKEERTVTLNLNKLEPAENKQFKEILKSAVLKEEQILLENEASRTIEDFKTKDADVENQKLLNFFRDKIPPEDYEALRASLYLRSKYDEGIDVYQLKADIMTKYGERGKNISNMCTAGYFEKWLIPLYKEMEQSPDFLIDKFKFTYDIIVKESAFAVFVHRDMRGEEVKDIILGKIHTNLEYGIKFVTIHGIGKENKKKIRETIAELESEHTFLRQSIEEEGSAIMARIRFE